MMIKYKNIDIEMLKAKLADAFILGQSWSDIAFYFPEADQELFNEVATEISVRLRASEHNSNPSDIYKGLGVEVDIADEGLLVKSVYKDSPAAKIGLHKGDYICEVNFESLKGFKIDDSIKKLRNSENSEGTVIGVIRNKEQKTLGFGLNISPKVIDNKRKYPANFTALLIGARLMSGNLKELMNSSTQKILKKDKSTEFVR